MHHDLFAQVRDSSCPTITQHDFDIVRHFFYGDHANGVEWALQNGLPRPHGARVPTTVSAYIRVLFHTKVSNAPK
jgi:hypothetical protein